MIGSFLNCLIWRLHTGEGMMDRSRCPKCKHKISWYDNIPVLSYLFLLGKCRHCKEGISWQYPVVEFVTGVLFLLAFMVEFPIDFEILNLTSFFIIIKSWFVISVMIIVFIYDLRWYLILDRVMIPSFIIVFLLNLASGYLSGNLVEILWKSLICGIIGGSFFLIQFLISKGKWIGGGDIRLGFLMGLVLLWPGVIIALMLAYISGAIISVFLIMIGKKKWGSQVPFGIFLSTATIVTMFWGQVLADWYLNLILVT
ncbi:hypothetical protein C0583_03635 [Candidatus Parcubacteria bacterium]|nr:MAG: hypothetical protein C0583_03635 [Candidatus Parcubacteria bacterium]